jgi:hypothetical protein
MISSEEMRRDCGILSVAIQQRPQSNAYGIIYRMNEANFQQITIQRFSMHRPVGSSEEIS